MKDFLRVLLTPSCWVQNCSYSRMWDAHLQELIAKETFVSIGHYTAKIGGITVWVANHPFASFTPHGLPFLNVRPSRATLLKAHDKLLSDVLALKKDL